LKEIDLRFLKINLFYVWKLQVFHKKTELEFPVDRLFQRKSTGKMSLLVDDGLNSINNIREKNYFSMLASIPNFIKIH
jgi:hypothetical protein